LKKIIIAFLFLAAPACLHASWECEWQEPDTPDLYSPEALNEAFTTETSAGKIAALALVRLYQLTLSGKTGTECVFYPSCSRYGLFAIKKYGLLKGSFMAGDRLMRCHQWADSYGYPVDYDRGLLYDPVEADDTFNFIFDWLNF
jgi:putative membrane protein insertion efficiency factor